MARRQITGAFIWVWILVVGLLVIPVTFHAAPQRSDYRVIRNIPLGGEGNWDYVTVDAEAKRVYIPRYGHIQVVDEVTGKLIGDITNVPDSKGVAVAPEFNRGFATGNDPEPNARIYLFDLKTLQVTSTLVPPGARHSDSISYDPVSKRAFINTALSNNVQAVDAATGRLLGTVTLPGRPEQAVPDGKGSIFVNIVDKSEVAEYDTTSLMVKNTWPSDPCNRGSGIAMDRAHRRLFLACQGQGDPQRDDPATVSKNLIVVMNADNGKVVASMPIGIGADGAAFDPSTGDVFVTCRDSGDGQHGATYIFHQDSPDRYAQVAEVKTIYGARTITLDSKTHHVFSIATEQNDPVPATADNPRPRPKPVRSTFELVEIGK